MMRAAWDSCAEEAKETGRVNVKQTERKLKALYGKKRRVQKRGAQLDHNNNNRRKGERGE